MSKIRARATYANVTATLALFIALGGGSFAVAALSGSEKKVVKKIAKKQADKLITARAPDLSVKHAGSADTATDAGHASSAGTADSATQAQNASTANGVKPIKVSFAAPSGTPATAFLDQGGVRISGECTALGEARLELTNTGGSGAVLHFGRVNADGSIDAGANLAMGSGTTQSVSTAAAPRNIGTVTVTYRGADGTEVSGNVMIARGADVAQCVMAGTLFVG